MRIAYILLLVIHGLIHLIGTASAFGRREVSRLSGPVSRWEGTWWLGAAILFVLSAGLAGLGSHSWWIAAIVAVICSQVLTVRRWTDAKFGTLVNVVVLLPVIATIVNELPSGFAHQYRREIASRLSASPDTSLLTEADIGNLPVPVRKYLRYAGAVGRPRVYNFRAAFHGTFKRSVTGDWMEIVSHQYNFFDNPARVFFIESSFWGIPFDGLHIYAGGGATMRIRIASSLQIVDAHGEKMFQGETVTLFNDMCVLAPPSLIDTSIAWETIDSLHAAATFTNRGYSIRALLTFNGEGALVDFTSNDRFLSSDGITYMRYPWSTPVGNYREIGGRRIAGYAEAIWQMPGGPYTYGKFDLESIEYNCREFQ